jgi:hypothetical protein
MSRVGDAGPDIELRGVVSWLVLRGNSPNGKLGQFASAAATRAATGEEAPFIAAASSSVSVVAAAAAVTVEDTKSSFCRGCCASSMTESTLRSFDSALREELPGGEDGLLGCRDGEPDEWAFVGVARSALEADDGSTSAQSDAASEYKVPLLCAHRALVPVANTSLVTVWGETIRGLGDDDGARMDRGGKMLNI